MDVLKFLQVFFDVIMKRFYYFFKISVWEKLYFILKFQVNNISSLYSLKL